MKCSLRRLFTVFLASAVSLSFWLLTFSASVVQQNPSTWVPRETNIQTQAIKTDKLTSPGISASKIVTESRNNNNTTHVISKKLKKLSLRALKLTSTVDYFACCGAGHRLSKLVDGYHLAKRYLKFGVRAFFGFCGKQEVFSWLFQTNQPIDADVFSQGLNLPVHNDVPGFGRLVRKGPTQPCPCPEERWIDDFELYQSLFNRFRGRDQVQRFLLEELQSTTHTIIGMHVRTGNGETGDFEFKRRGITDRAWFDNMAQRLVQLSQSWNLAPILFLATDTVSIEETFRSLLSEHMEVVTWNQRRPEQGHGVFFGQNYHNDFNTTTDQMGNDPCLEGWQDVFTDMMILSQTDVVVAARPSSFTQSLPLVMSLSKEIDQRKVKQSYCEVDPSATEVKCFHSLQEWCCNGTTQFSLKGIQPWDYLRMPDEATLKSKEMEMKIQARPMSERECIPTPRNIQRTCLPYQMPNASEVEAEGSMFLLPGENKTADAN